MAKQPRAQHRVKRFLGKVKKPPKIFLFAPDVKVVTSLQIIPNGGGAAGAAWGAGRGPRP